MYNFIFWVLYSANINNGAFTAKFQATLIVYFSIFIHVLLLLTILKKYFYRIFISLHLNNLVNYKALEISILIICFILIYRYYSVKRINKVVQKHSVKQTYPPINRLKVALIVFAPLISIIVILNSLK